MFIDPLGVERPHCPRDACVQITASVVKNAAVRHVVCKNMLEDVCRFRRRHSAQEGACLEPLEFVLKLGWRSIGNGREKR